MTQVRPQIRAVKGMNDVLAEDVGRWQRIEAAFARTMALQGFREVRTPYVEPTGLFVRAIGEVTDIVEKEMYSFAHHGDELTLRPAVHAREPVTRWWYTGPMFRAERPQRGRYRQFSQLGVEIFGDEGPGCDAEMIDMLVGFLGELRVPGVEVLVNSLGGPETRVRYRDALVAHFTPQAASLSATSQRRLETNPLRILDSKDERDQEAVANAPSIREFLDATDEAHFVALLAHLDALGTPYKVEPRLVRGLDYYTRTLFEIKGAHDKLGAGSTLVGGGRYDGMVADLGGPNVPAFGFGAGVDRLLIASEFEVPASIVDAVVAPLGAAAVARALVLGRDLRRGGVRCEVGTRDASLKSQLRRANTLGARFVLILGDSELAQGTVQFKDLEQRTQDVLPLDQAAVTVAARLSREERP